MARKPIPSKLLPLFALLCACGAVGRKAQTADERQGLGRSLLTEELQIRLHHHHLRESHGEALEDSPHDHEHRREQRSTTGGIAYELVVARYNEDLDWLKDVSELYELTIYNKGGEDHPMPSPPPGRRWTVIELPNAEREAHTYAEHLVRRYDTLANYTVFSQGDPFGHNKYYLELLNSPWLLGSVQTMSRVWKRDHTPMSDFEYASKHPWYRSERLSTRTLNSVWFHDEGTVAIQREYRERYNLPPGTNLIHHYFDLIGLKDWVPDDLEVASFAYGAQVGFERSKAQQHPKHVYEKLLETTTVGTNGYLIERTWIVLFGGPHFMDV